MEILLGIFAIIVGLVNWFFPDIVYMISEAWKSEGMSGPSEEYRKRTRGAGIFLILMGIVILVLKIAFWDIV
jgi:hypothetical protein